MSTKLCKECNQEKQIPNEIYNASHICYGCKNKIKTKEQQNRENRASILEESRPKQPNKSLSKSPNNSLMLYVQ